MISAADQEQLLQDLQVFKFKGKDKRGRKILQIFGKFFPARIVSAEVVNKYLQEKVFPELDNRPFAVLYFHTGVEKNENFLGISAMRSIYDSIPAPVRQNLEAVYFVHPGLQSRLFLATFGRIIFSGGLYAKLRYITRLDYLWEHVRRNAIEIPEYVHDHDADLEYRPMMDYGVETDHVRVHGTPVLDTPEPMLTMRCIS